MADESVEGYSPVPEAKKFTFSEAVNVLAAGKKVHKLEWQDKEFYGVLEGGILKLHKPDGKFYSWVLSDGDLSGDDYIII